MASGTDVKRWIQLGALSLIAGGAGCVMARPAMRAVAPPPAALEASQVQFSSASGSTIHAWLSKGKRGLGAVLLLHGVGENRSRMLARAEFLHDAGYTVLAPDFQAHGESPGEHITFGARESFDAHAAISFLRTAAPGERIGVIGVSMGGAAALLGPEPVTADALVLESVYPTIDQALSDRLHVWLGPLGFLAAPITPVLMRTVGDDIGVDGNDLRPIDHIGAVTEPLLVLAGTKDQYTPLDESKALFARAHSPKSFWAVQGAEHEDLYDFAPLDYERIVGTFLAANLRGAPSPHH